MQVFVEYALLENFCMDFTLLVASKWASKNPTGYFRIALSALIGACFAVAFPLFGLTGALAVIVKVVAGGGMCAVAGKYSSLKGYAKFTAVFTASTFLIGGALIALFSLADIGYAEGGGVILSSVPIGIPLFAVAVLAITVRKISSAFSKAHPKGDKITANCQIFCGEKSATCTAFYDSGNKVYLNGAPVSIIPRHIAGILTGNKRINDFVDIHTVAGQAHVAVFRADRVVIDDGNSVIERCGVMLGVSPQMIFRAVLNPDLLEVN